MDPLSKTTVIIKTFQRPESLDRAIRSIRRYYPKLHIIVADDGFKPALRTDVEYVRLPTDVGISTGRNALLDRVTTPYYLLIDDDVEFRPQTKIEKLASLVDQGELDLAAGSCLRIERKWKFLLRRKPQPFHGLFSFTGGDLRLVGGTHGTRDGYSLCDIAHNFYVARVDRIRSMGAWDPELRQNEHTEFFVRARRHGIRVGYCHDVVVWHWVARPEGYGAYRFRSYHDLAARKIGVDRIIGFEGQVFAYDGPKAKSKHRKQVAVIPNAA